MLTTEEWQELSAKVRSEVSPAIIHIDNREQDLAEDPIDQAIRTGANVVAPPPSVFETYGANCWTDKAAATPDPVSLWHDLWFENEVCCLFADTNVGKSIYAVQIADELAKTHRVLYFDFEMSAKQFQMRYTDAATSTRHRFPADFLRTEFRTDADVCLPVDEIFGHIEREVTDRKVTVVIIDNITWLCNNCESGDSAGEFMQLLIGLKRRLNLSVLVLAHTPKRNINAPLTQNSLAGSKRIANFMDSVMALGIDRTNSPSGRYIKQIKARSTEVKYGADNVITARITKEGGFLRLEHTGNAPEESLLDTGDEADAKTDRRSLDPERIDQIRRRIGEGESARSISREMGVCLRTVLKYKPAA